MCVMFTDLPRPVSFKVIDKKTDRVDEAHNAIRNNFDATLQVQLNFVISPLSVWA